MRNFIQTATTVRGLIAICLAMTGPSLVRMAHTAGTRISRAYSIPVASRTQNILA